MTLYALSIESMIRGYHEYKLIWNNPVVGEDLLCEREVANPHDTHVVAVKVIDGNLTVVGHIPFSICSIFLRRGGKTLLSFLFITNGLKILQYRHLQVLESRVTVLTCAFKENWWKKHWRMKLHPPMFFTAKVLCYTVAIAAQHHGFSWLVLNLIVYFFRQ